MPLTPPRVWSNSASTLSEATTILLESDGAARVVAGAQSLGPMLNLRLVQPRVLVDITGIAELTEIEDRDDAVTLGACITTANIEDGRLPGREVFQALLKEKVAIVTRAGGGIGQAYAEALALQRALVEDRRAGDAVRMQVRLGQPRDDRR